MEMGLHQAMLCIKKYECFGYEKNKATDEDDTIDCPSLPKLIAFVAAPADAVVIVDDVKSFHLVCM